MFKFHAHDPQKLERELEAFARTTCDLLGEEVGRTDTCILSTRFAVDYLSRAGLDVRALPVEVCLYNQAWHDKAEALGRFPQSEEEAQDWVRAGCWSVGIGLGYPDERGAPFGKNPDKPRYNGHLVAIVERAFIVDISLPQANRPEHGIVVEPLVLKIAKRSFLHGTSREVGGVKIDDNPPVWISYEPYASERSYRNTPDWQRGGDLPELRDAVTARLADLENGTPNGTSVSETRA